MYRTTQLLFFFLCIFVNCCRSLQTKAGSDERDVRPRCWSAQQYLRGVWKCDDWWWPLLRPLPMVPSGWKVKVGPNKQYWENRGFLPGFSSLQCCHSFFYDTGRLSALTGVPKKEEESPQFHLVWSGTIKQWFHNNRNHLVHCSLSSLKRSIVEGLFFIPPTQSLLIFLFTFWQTAS